jgi:hypothetical protein
MGVASRDCGTEDGELPWRLAVIDVAMESELSSICWKAEELSDDIFVSIEDCGCISAAETEALFSCCVT